MLRLKTSKSFWIFILIIAAVSLIGFALVNPFFTNPPTHKRTEWAYEMVQIPELNDLGMFGSGVTVAIIDTGIDLSHPELKHVKLVAWRDIINQELIPYDDDGHGTAMAGIIAGKTFGVAPEVDLIVVKALDAVSGATDSNIYAAMRFCIQEGADIISLSLGRDEMRMEDLTGPWDESDLQRVCQQATDEGIFLVVSAGNDGGENDDGEVSVPGVHDDAITVGAVKKNKKIADFSSQGQNDGRLPNIIIDWDPWEREDPDKKPEIVAPGVDIVAPWINKEYWILGGTSMSVPFVTGSLACILGELPKYQHENNSGEADITKVKEKIKSTTMKLSEQQTPHDDKYGYGLFQAYDLYLALKDD
jgi:subtilisin family serine protease